MYLNKYFNSQNINLYIEHLKNTQRSNSSIKRKISSLSSFQKFLIRKKYLEPVNIQFAPKKTDTDLNPDRDNILDKIKNIFAVAEVYPVENPVENPKSD